MVLASRVVMRTLGWRSAMAVSRGGMSQRAVVPMMPRLTWPATSSRNEATSAVRASSSVCTRRARATTTSPSPVRRPAARSTSVTPSSFSSRATWVETLDWTVCSLVGRGREGARLGHGDEGGELAEIHRRQ